MSTCYLMVYRWASRITIFGIQVVGSLENWRSPSMKGGSS